MVRGRPRKTDPKDAMNAIMLTFWAKGYDATSLSDLVSATGMAKPGLYATFGDKEELYKKALEFYVSERRNERLFKDMNSKKTTKEAFNSFYNGIADIMCDPTNPDGCFLVNTLVKSENNEPALKETAKFYYEFRRNAILDYLEKAQKSGYLSNKNDVVQLADYLSAQILTIATLQKIGTDRDEIGRFIDTVLMIIRE